MGSANYKIVGRHYRKLREPDPTIAHAIQSELKSASSIINIGAGTGSYEPMNKFLVAVVPSEKMLSQRNRDNSHVVWAQAEKPPFATDSFEIAMALLTIHRGLRLPVDCG